MDWSNKNVLITGAGGFIGSHLTEKLLELGSNVTAFLRYGSKRDKENLNFIKVNDKSKLNVFFGDILDLPAVNESIKDADVVFHLAANISVAYSMVHPAEVFNTNAIGTLNILNAAKDNNVKKIVLMSSSEVYGTAQYAPIDEKHVLQAQSPYSASKISAEKIAESFFRCYNTPVTIARPFNNYGPRQTARAIIPTIISQALINGKIKIGNTNPTRDFLFVKDTVEGLIKLAETKEAIGQAFNLATGKEISIGELKDLILSLLNKKVEVEIDEQRVRSKTSEVERLCGDSKKINEVTGWSAKVNLEDGLKQTIEWIRANTDLFNTKEYNI